MTTPDPAPLSRRLDRAVRDLRSLVGGASPEVALVLGSGLGALADELVAPTYVAYAKIPGFPASTVEGHRGRLAFGGLGGRSVVAMQGRVHLYEGYSAADVAFPVQVMLSLGAHTLVVTNAAGGLDPAYRPGELMLIRDHLNLTGTSALLGPNDSAVGPRFPDMSTAYDPALRDLARSVSAGLGVRLHEGVYAGLLGPSFETPAEIRMLAALGADAVGMSTVHEVVAANHMGAKVVGISCISNPAAGLSDRPLAHDDVQAAAELARADLRALVTGIVEGVS